MAADLTLYTNPMSRGRIARWMLEEVGAPYETVVLDYGTTMKNDAYRAINPMMKVPAIVHQGTVVTEVAAICAYLADAFPQAGLAPAPAERGDYYCWLFFGAGPLEAAITNRSMGVEPDARQQQMAGYGTLDLTAGTLESMLKDRDYIAGNRFSAADVYVGSSLMWYTGFGLLPKSAPFMAYIARIADRPAHRRASEIDDALMPAKADAG